MNNGGLSKNKRIIA
jgi:hypothetical protein